MNRLALSLSLMLATAPIALAEGNRSLGVTVVPVGGYYLADAGAQVAGYTAGIGWDYSQPSALLAVAGHVSTSLRLTQATPVSVRLCARPGERVRPCLGAGVGLMLEHPPDGLAGSPLKVGPELHGAVRVGFTDVVFASAEARYQSFAPSHAAFKGPRCDLASLQVGLGFSL